MTMKMRHTNIDRYIDSHIQIFSFIYIDKMTKTEAKMTKTENETHKHRDIHTYIVTYRFSLLYIHSRSYF